MATPVSPVVASAAPSRLTTAKDAFGSGFTAFSRAVSRFEANLGKGINVSLSQPFVGPLADGEERTPLTTLQKAGNIVKTVFNGVDNAGAAISRAIFAGTEQLFGRPQVVANEDAVSLINNQMINGKGDVVLPAGALLTAPGTFRLNAQGHILNAQGKRVDLAGEVAEDKKIYNLAGRVTNVVAHVAAVAVRAVAIALAAIASVICSIFGIVIGTPVAAVIGAVKGIQNKMQATADAKAAAASDLQLRQMRAFAIGINTSKAATAGREEVLNSIAFVNALVPVNADGSVVHIDEQAAQQARILLANRLAQLDAEYAASLKGRIANGISSTASKVAGTVSSIVSPVIAKGAAFASNHSTALKVAGAVTGAGLALGTGAYLFPGVVPYLVDTARTYAPSVFGKSVAALAAEEAAKRPSILSTAAYYGLGLLGLGAAGTIAYTEHRIRRERVQNDPIIIHDRAYLPRVRDDEDEGISNSEAPLNGAPNRPISPPVFDRSDDAENGLNTPFDREDAIDDVESGINTHPRREDVIVPTHPNLVNDDSNPSQSLLEMAFGANAFADDEPEVPVISGNNGERKDLDDLVLSDVPEIQQNLVINSPQARLMRRGSGELESRTISRVSDEQKGLDDLVLSDVPETQQNLMISGQKARSISPSSDELQAPMINGVNDDEVLAEEIPVVGGTGGQQVPLINGGNGGRVDLGNLDDLLLDDVSDSLGAQGVPVGSGQQARLMSPGSDELQVAVIGGANGGQQNPLISSVVEEEIPVVGDNNGAQQIPVINNANSGQQAPIIDANNGAQQIPVINGTNGGQQGPLINGLADSDDEDDSPRRRSDSPDRQRQTSYYDESSSSDDDSFFGSGWGSGELLLGGGFPAGEFPSWFPEDEKKRKY